MPEWIREEGIGETRFALVEGEDIVEARILPEGIVQAGKVISAALVSLAPRTIARDDHGREYLLPEDAPGLTEGAKIEIEVWRSAIPGPEPWKRALARIPGSGRDGGEKAVDVKNGRLPQTWNDLIDQTRNCVVPFAGGELRISPTPAMTLIDVDGWLAADELALVGAAEAARAIRRLDIGGSIGIDLPTCRGKAARQEAAAAVDAILPRPFERTAVNGFGFLQIVRPRRRASIVELAQDRVAFEARDLLRRLANEPPGAKRIVAHPKLVRLLEAKSDWLGAIARTLGGAIALRADAALPMSGGYAEPF